MSAKYKNVFDSWLFSERLPDEFYKLDSVRKNTTNKRKVTSQLTTDSNWRGHGERTSILIGACCSAVMSFVKMLRHEPSEKLAISTYDTDDGRSYIAAYKRDDGTIEIATYSPSVPNDECAFKIALINSDGSYVKATFSDTDHNFYGSAIFASILPKLCEGKEFSRAVVQLSKYNDMTEDAADLYGIICDIAYRCTANPETSAKGVPEHLLINGNRAGNRVPLLTEDFINTVECETASISFNGEKITFNPVDVFCSKSNVAKVRISKKFIDQRKKMLELGAYTAENWNPDLAKLIPEVEPTDIVPDEAIEIAETYLLSLSSPCPVNNFMLKGEAGSGKSTICHKYVPALLGMPCLIYSCNADTTADELLVSLQPKSDVLGADGKLVSNYKTTSDNWTDVTSEEEIMTDPVTAWEQLTGEKRATVSSLDCFRYITSNYVNGCGGAKFVAVKSAIITAAEQGFCCEIQELDVVRNDGVPASLNSLLEEGVISMPNGERVYRNPHNIMFFTVNEDYIGCNELNQAVLDRIPIKEYLDTPTKKVLIARAKKETGFDDDSVLEKMAEFMTKLKTYCRDSGITNGTVGYRSFKAWVQAYMFNPRCKGDIYKSALCTVMTSASQTRELVTELIENVLNANILPDDSNARTKSTTDPNAVRY